MLFYVGGLFYNDCMNQSITVIITLKDNSQLIKKYDSNISVLIYKKYANMVQLGFIKSFEIVYEK
jgi:hypothetical protein